MKVVRFRFVGEVPLPDDAFGAGVRIAAIAGLRDQFAAVVQEEGGTCETEARIVEVRIRNEPVPEPGPILRAIAERHAADQKEPKE